MKGMMEVDAVREFIATYFRMAKNLDAGGLCSNMPFINPDEGVCGAIRSDMLLCIMSVSESDAIDSEFLDFLNENMDCGFTSQSVAKVRRDFATLDGPPECTMLPHFIMMDLERPKGNISKHYLKMLAFTALGYLTWKEDTNLTEYIRYNWVFTEIIEIYENTFGKNIDFDPLGDANITPVSIIKYATSSLKGSRNREKSTAAKAFQIALDMLLGENGKERIRKLKENASLSEDDEEEDDEVDEPENKIDEEDGDHIKHKEQDKNIETQDAQKSNENTDRKTDISSDDEPDENNNDLEDATDECESDPLKELESLTGLSDVKGQIRSILNVLKVRKKCEEHGIKREPIALHMVFSGNPGTGKTTVARLLGKIYKESGLLSKGHFVEVSRAELVGKYVGHTAILVKKAFDKAKGGILFIDEAYSLNNSDDAFGQEAVETIIKLMEDYRDDLAVIAAGYPGLMQELLDSNPGLRSRFPFVLKFPDYTGDELTDIFRCFCAKNNVHADFSVMRLIYSHFNREAAKRVKNFGNARYVRNYFEQMLLNQADRLYRDGALDEDGDLEKDDLCYFSIDDIPDDKLVSELTTKPKIFRV